MTSGVPMSAKQGGNEQVSSFDAQGTTIYSQQRHAFQTYSAVRGCMK